MWDFADDGDLYFEKAVSDIIKFGGESCVKSIVENQR